MSRIYSLWMIISDGALSAIEISDLFKTTSLLHFFNDFLSSSLSTYQDIRNAALERANTSLYRWTKSFHKLNTVISRRYDDDIDYLLQCIDLNRDADVCNTDRHSRYIHTHICQCRSCTKDSRRLLELITFNLRISFTLSRLRWTSARHIQWKFWYLYIINLFIVAARASYLRSKNEPNDKERKKESEEGKNKQYLYIR